MIGEVDRAEELARQLRQAAERCCQCTDGHHDWIPAYPYGTDGDVRMTRDLARELADILAARVASAAADREAVERVRALAEEMCAFDIVDMPVPESVDVPDDYELAVNDYGLRLHAALSVPTEAAGTS